MHKFPSKLTNQLLSFNALRGCNSWEVFSGEAAPFTPCIEIGIRRYVICHFTVALWF